MTATSCHRHLQYPSCPPTSTSCHRCPQYPPCPPDFYLLSQTPTISIMSPIFTSCDRYPQYVEYFILFNAWYWHRCISLVNKTILYLFYLWFSCSPIPATVTYNIRQSPYDIERWYLYWPLWFPYCHRHLQYMYPSFHSYYYWGITPILTYICNWLPLCQT